MSEHDTKLSRLYRRTRQSADHCPDSAALADLAGGRVWPWQRRKLLGHLSTCSHCAAEMRSLLAIQGGLHDALGVARPSMLGRPGWMAAFGTAGACAAALAVILLLPGHDRVDAPTAPGKDLLFASTFAEGAAGTTNDTLFRGDFDGDFHDNGPDRLFASDFGEPLGG
jgi:hypothetical protein